VREKSKFLKQQVAGIDSMVTNYRNLIARINVLRNAVKMLRLEHDQSVSNTYDDQETENLGSGY